MGFIGALTVRSINDDELPSVAVVIPCYNAQKWISRAIQSVLDQHYPKLELIVIDDGSSDQSVQAIKSFQHYLQWETGPNRGACAARNKGLQKTAADFVIFLDADDYMEGTTLIKELAIAARAHGLDLVIGVSASVRDGLRLQIHSHPAESTREELLRYWLTGKYVQTGALMWSTSFLRRVGAWNERVRRSQDIELVLRALLSGAKVRATPHGTVAWRDHPSTSRVGKSRAEAALASEYDFHVCLLMTFPELQMRFTREVGIRFYSIASEAYLYGYDRIGKQALGKARELGVRGHIGTQRHRFMSTILGLRGKQRLNRWTQVMRPRRG